MNECPVDIQSRTPTKRKREFESLRGYQIKKDAKMHPFCFTVFSQGLERVRK